ncbi:LolA family protein [Desulfolithobacter sp.]
MYRISLLLLPVLLFFSTTVLGALPAENDVVRDALALQERYQRLTSLRFDFTQITRAGGRERSGQGEAVFLRPTGHKSVMRWDYLQPERQIIVSDGQTLSIYTEKDKQMIVTPASALESDITYGFFSGTRNLLDDFNALPPDTRYLFSVSGSALRSIRLVPRQPHPQVKEVLIWFDRDYLIHRVLIEDHFDTVTELTFVNIRTDELRPDDSDALQKITHLSIPPDTEIITQ